MIYSPTSRMICSPMNDLRVQRVQSCVTPCSASAVMRYGVLVECSHALRRARRVQSCVTGCSASAVLRTSWSGVQLCVPYWVVSANVFHYGHNNGEEYGVYTISSGDSGSRIVLSLVAAVSAPVHGKTFTASEGGRRRKSAYMTQRLFSVGASHPPMSGTMYVYICYLQPNCHMAGVPLLLRRPELFYISTITNKKPSPHNGSSNHFSAYNNP